MSVQLCKHGLSLAANCRNCAFDNRDRGNETMTIDDNLLSMAKIEERLIELEHKQDLYSHVRNNLVTLSVEISLLKERISNIKITEHAEEVMKIYRDTMDKLSKR